MTAPVAIVDYGIGGLGLAKLIKNEYPNFPISYFSDSGEVPYGKLPGIVLKKRIERVLEFLQSAKINHIIIACHSASSVITEEDNKIIGIRNLTIEAATKEKVNNMGIIGGGRTIKSGYYRKHISATGTIVKQKIAQELSILVERGEIDSENVQKTVKAILDPLKNLDSLLLACTHYSALLDHFRKALNENTLIIDPIGHVFEYLKQSGLFSHSLRGRDFYMTTGNPELMKFAARKSFNMSITLPKKISL